MRQPLRLARSTSSASLCAVLVVAGCSLVSCAEDVPTDTGFAEAFFHDDCAPWDGPALTIVLSQATMADPFEPPYPHARITSYRPPARLPGSSVEWAGTAQDQGYATMCDSTEACTPATRVDLRFDRGQADPDVLRGEIRLELEDGRVVGGPFEARRIELTALCG